jgi:hypothetical protein
MSIDGPWFVTRAALDDFERLVPGSSPAALRAEIDRAHFVKRQGDGSEIWRSGKPLRLRFIVRTGAGVGGDAPQLVRVEGDHAARSGSASRCRTVRVWDGASYRSLDVTDEICDPGPDRRVAYRLTSGHWLSGTRGRSRPDEVLLGPQRNNPPDWVRELRGQRSRRGRDR